MKIDQIRSTFRHIVLLAREYREKIAPDETNEINRLRSKNTHEGLGTYDRQYLEAVEEIQQRILDQIEFFAKQLLDQFATKVKSTYDVDPNKVEYARKELTLVELSLLGDLYEMQVQKQVYEKDKKGKPVKAVELEPKLHKLISTASRIRD